MEVPSFAQSKRSQYFSNEFSTTKSEETVETSTVHKFYEGDEIKDKKNPFRLIDDENIFVTHKGITDTDFVTKEDVLKESKYVPVYIKNPDRVLTYDKTVIEKLSTVKPKVVKRATNPKVVDRAPVPLPRKSVDTSFKKKRLLHRENYPDIKDMKVRINRFMLFHILIYFFLDQSGNGL